MAKTRYYRAFRDVEEDYFRDNPTEIASYIDEILDDYAQDGNSRRPACFIARDRQSEGHTVICD